MTISSKSSEFLLLFAASVLLVVAEDDGTLVSFDGDVECTVEENSGSWKSAANWPGSSSSATEPHAIFNCLFPKPQNPSIHLCHHVPLSVTKFEHHTISVWIPCNSLDLLRLRLFLPLEEASSSSLISTSLSCVLFCPGDGDSGMGPFLACAVWNDSLKFTKTTSFLSSVMPSKPSTLSSSSYVNELLHISVMDSLIMRTRRSCSTDIRISGLA